MSKSPDTEGDKAIRFIEKLCHPEGTEWAGRPLKLMEWQKAYIRKLLDTKNEQGFPQYEKSLLFMPKKQAKTTLIAALALYFLVGWSHQQVVCLAQVKEQAGLIYKFVASMIRQNEALADRACCRIYKGNQKKIECYSSDSTLSVLSSDAVGANGLNASVLLYDEVCFSETSELWDAVISGGISRERMLAIGLSTAGMSTSGFGYQFYEQAKAILENPALDPTFLPVIYEAPMDADWTDPQVYMDCSPLFREMGTAALRRITAMIEAAKKDPSQLRRLRRYHLNQWIGADSKTPWIDIAAWDASTFDFDLESLNGMECYGGLDLASEKDTTALALLFPLPNNRFVLLMRFYIPADKIAEKERLDQAQYSMWQKMGVLTATPGDWTDFAYVRADINALKTKYRIAGIAVDRAYNAAHISQELLTDGVKVEPIGQGTMTVTPAAREIEMAVTQKRLHHGAHPVMRWQISNAIAKVVDHVGNVRPVKTKSTARIDGIYAAINAFALEMSTRASRSTTGGGFFAF